MPSLLAFSGRPRQTTLLTFAQDAIIKLPHWMSTRLLTNRPAPFL